MTAARSAMLLAGAAFAGMASVAGLFRAVGLMDEEKVAPEVFWAVLFVMLVLGVMLLVFAPTSRHTERRVELGPETVSHSTRPKAGRTSRRGGSSSSGSRSSGSRSSSSPSTTSAKSARKHPPSSPRNSPASSSGGAAPVASSKSQGQQESSDRANDHGGGPNGAGVPAAPTASTAPADPLPRAHGAAPRPPSHVHSRHHPNDVPAADLPHQNPDPEPVVAGDEAAPPSLRGRAARRGTPRSPAQDDEPVETPPRRPEGGRASSDLQQQMEPSPPPQRPPSVLEPPSPDPPGTQGSSAPEADHRVRFQRRREELEARLESLDQRLNQAKVSMGLGRISHAGYRQYVKEVERERTLIEGELMTLRDEL